MCLCYRVVGYRILASLHSSRSVVDQPCSGPDSVFASRSSTSARYPVPDAPFCFAAHLPLRVGLSNNRVLVCGGATVIVWPVRQPANIPWPRLFDSACDTTLRNIELPSRHQTCPTARSRRSCFSPVLPAPAAPATMAPATMAQLSLDGNDGRPRSRRDV